MLLLLIPCWGILREVSTKLELPKLDLEPDHYVTLGIPPSSPKKDIKKAYRNFMMNEHPDRVRNKAINAGKSDEQVEKLVARADFRSKRAVEAKEVLTDEKERKVYDFKRARSYKALEGRRAMLFDSGDRSGEQVCLGAYDEDGHTFLVGGDKILDAKVWAYIPKGSDVKLSNADGTWTVVNAFMSKQGSRGYQLKQAETVASAREDSVSHIVTEGSDECTGGKARYTRGYQPQPEEHTEPPPRGPRATPRPTPPPTPPPPPMINQLEWEDAHIDYFALLGVRADATEEQIKEAYTAEYARMEAEYSSPDISKREWFHVRDKVLEPAIDNLGTRRDRERYDWLRSLYFPTMVGKPAMLYDLTAAELNGVRVTVLGYDAGRGRFQCQLPAGEKYVSPRNVWFYYPDNSHVVEGPSSDPYKVKGAGLSSDGKPEYTVEWVEKRQAQTDKVAARYVVLTSGCMRDAPIDKSLGFYLNWVKASKPVQECGTSCCAPLLREDGTQIDCAFPLKLDPYTYVYGTGRCKSTIDATLNDF